MSRPPRHDRSGETSYNRREMPPSQGLFSGPDGVFTIRPKGSRPAAQDTPPPAPVPVRRETLLCEPGYTCDTGTKAP